MDGMSVCDGSLLVSFRCQVADYNKAIQRQERVFKQYRVKWSVDIT